MLHEKEQKIYATKTNMTMEKQAFEDVYPFKHPVFPLSC